MKPGSNMLYLRITVAQSVSPMDHMGIKDVNFRLFNSSSVPPLLPPNCTPSVWRTLTYHNPLVHYASISIAAFFSLTHFTQSPVSPS